MQLLLRADVQQLTEPFNYSISRLNLISGYVT